MSTEKSSSTSKSTKKSLILPHLKTKDGRSVTTRGYGENEELYIVFKKDGTAYTANSTLVPILEEVGKIKGFGPVGLCG